MGRGVGDIPSDMLQGFGTPEDVEEERAPVTGEERVATEAIYTTIDRRRHEVKPGEVAAAPEVKPGEVAAPEPVAATPEPVAARPERRKVQQEAERWAQEERRAERFVYELEEA